MSEEKQKDSGITTDDDIHHRTAYVETIPTKKPKVRVERRVNKSREIKLGSNK